MPKITFLGDKGLLWIVAGLVLLCFKKYRKCGAMVLIGLLCGVIIGNGILKPLIAAPRPCWLVPDPNMLIAVPTDYSFPSGHTLSSTIAAFILTSRHPRFGWFAIPAAVLIIFSRLYLYVHFPSDLLAGILLGLLLAGATVTVCNRITLSPKLQRFFG